MIVVDASTVDEATAAWIRHGLVDLVEQLPDYDTLTLLASADAVRVVVDNATLEGQARDATRAAIERLEFGGTRRLVAGVEGVVRQAVKAGPGPAYETLIIATGSDGATVVTPNGGGPSDANGSSNIGFHLHGVAIGAGDHEALLSRLGGTYQWARTGADLSLALVPFRLAISEATLLAIGPVPADGQTANALVGPFHFGVRFTTYSPGRSVGFELVAPNGRTVDVNAHQEEVTVQEFGDRISIVVNGIDGGDWQVRFKDSGGSHVGAWFEVEETGTLSDPLLTAYGTGDTTNELKLGVGLPEGATYTASARIVGADGTEPSMALGSLKQDDLNIARHRGRRRDHRQAEAGGSYRICLSAGYTDATGQRIPRGSSARTWPSSGQRRRQDHRLRRKPSPGPARPGGRGDGPRSDGLTTSRGACERRLDPGGTRTSAGNRTAARSTRAVTRSIARTTSRRRPVSR
jgi:hypothetical protein